MAKLYSKSEFHILMKKIEATYIRVKKYLELAGYKKWARSYAIVHRGWTLTSNIAESINGVLVSARELPIYDFLEEVRLLLYQPRICVYGTRQTKALHCLNQGKKCSCNAFQIDEIPCAHAYAALEKKNFEKGPCCFDLFKLKTVLKTYDVPIYPLPYIDDWIITGSILDEIVLPPEFKRPLGRPAKKDHRKSGWDMFGKKNINSCGGCEAKGHNRRSYRKYRK
ncbi:uncharacterized protein LOC124894831 [Capsicum annuum]|uniref:uncharacterized protein LOC124894831 n=1 Tax=Capsicum annuum TaxID=4072 RepID=UPI001FB10409|nr:uncharacterized protein LOC124894831 [Capsicum annuum]